MGSANAQIFVYGTASKTLTLINPNHTSQQAHAVRSNYQPDQTCTGPEMTDISLQRIEFKGVRQLNYPQLTTEMNFSRRS